MITKVYSPVLWMTCTSKEEKWTCRIEKITDDNRIEPVDIEVRKMYVDGSAEVDIMASPGKIEMRASHPLLPLMFMTREELEKTLRRIPEEFKKHRSLEVTVWHDDEISVCRTGLYEDEFG